MMACPALPPMYARQRQLIGILGSLSAAQVPGWIIEVEMHRLVHRSTGLKLKIIFI